VTARGRILYVVRGAGKPGKAALGMTKRQPEGVLYGYRQERGKAIRKKGKHPGGEREMMVCKTHERIDSCRGSASRVREFRGNSERVGTIQEGRTP